MLKSIIISSALIVATANIALAGSGTFRGASGHETTGSVTVTEKGDQLIIQLGDNFSLDNAPDAYVSIGNGLLPVKGGTAGLLKNLKGAGTYTIPATAKNKAAKNVIIWCKKFAVPLGVATLK